MWPSSQASKMLTVLLALIVLYCVAMDTMLFLRIRYYKIDVYDEIAEANATERAKGNLRSYESAVWVPCVVNPLCYPTVKALLVDHVNHYLYGPLSAAVDLGLRISHGVPFITPNMISFFHVFVALVGAKLLTCQSLTTRRIGIVLFQLRMFLDDLDGHVARERKNIKGEKSEVGTLGYWVDGVCDLIGVAAMVAGIVLYLRSNPPRRGYRNTPLSTLPYHQLKEINSSEDIEKEHAASEVGISYKTKVSFRRVVQVVGLFSGQMVISSIAWNRYIDAYQELLEGTAWDVTRRAAVFRSGVFFSATGMWRVVNPHSYLHLLSLAVFSDKTWGFLRAVHHTGFLCLVAAVVASEYYVVSMRRLLGDPS
ncbi:Ceramide phosphoethanolamine synthase [Eumeta japonica]|uniref:Ceramide phosphoethanolamine synthase n=1 Tax=Eumeta variegata TaxID=151549 RepID=A0A4C1Z6I3_EUMVA|nr:Ceramide phosphoethanolamine synthase [Eumeta japonica]